MLKRIPNILLMLLLAIGLSAQNTACEIYDLVASAGDCTSDSTYQLKLNFKVENPTNDEFDLWGNGKFVGTYKLSELPLIVNNFPAAPGGVVGGYLKVCINDNPDCCRIYQFIAPNCKLSVPCEIYDVSVQTGDCNPDGTYKLTLNFKVADPTSDFFEVWASNGKYLGAFPLNQLPLSLAFPWGGGAADGIKICIKGNPNCCKTKEFPVPDCFNPCQLRNVRVDAGDCTSDSTYAIKFTFTAPAGVDSFGVWAGNGKFLGRFAVADLPIGIDKFPWGGGSVDAIKICVKNTCCRTKEFNVPECLAPPCGIVSPVVEVGGCTSPKTYKVVLNFKVDPNVPGTNVKFNVYADNGNFLGTYGTADLPLSLDFPWNGDPTDAVKICLLDDNGKDICCEIVQFKAPDCLGIECGIFNLTVKTGDCNDDGKTYQVWINFQTPAASLQKFGIWSGTGQFLGFFSVANLPIHIPKFPWSGGSVDKILICFANGCCVTKEFNPPDCIAKPCGIVDLTATPGDCNDDGTYQLKINFSLLTVPPGPTPFAVYAGTGEFLGNFTTNDLPLLIQNFPASGNASDAVKICIGNSANTYCCRVVEFKAPDCTGGPCGLFNLTVKTGDCNDDGTYNLWINFQTTSAAGLVLVYNADGTLLGSFPLSALPIHIPHFKGSGKDVDAVKICLVTTAGTVPCCVTKEFKAPDCNTDPCGIKNLAVQTGDCNPDGTYNLWLKFELSNPTVSAKFAVYANGKLFGEFSLSDLPLHIKNFPTDGGPNDVIKVCIISPLTVLCCETLEFKAPDCAGGPCEISDLTVKTGDCSSDKTYKLELNFKAHNVGADAKFAVFANGQLLGYYALDQLPLTIPSFPSDGGPNDVVKVCIATNNTGSVTCCAVKEFPVPDCIGHPCDIYDMKVETGKCNDDGTAYELWLNFKVTNPPSQSTHFGVWGNGELLGFFTLNQLPLYFPNFKTNGGPNDVIKVCLTNTGTVGCCETLEFHVPDCIQGACEIYDAAVTTGDCNDDGTYRIKIDFKVENPGNDYFEVWAGNGTYLGHFKLSELPLAIAKFPGSGADVDKIKICINDQPNCCRVVEFKAPDCAPGGCDITDLKVETGDCNADGTYRAWVNFKINNPSNTTVFGVWANGHFLGTFGLNKLPLLIEKFPTDGGPNDVVKVCILVPGTTQALCCETLEFKVPDCVPGGCNIENLKVETGDCNDDGTYHAWVNFTTGPSPTPLFFGVWANGEFLGSFPLSNLPFHIEHFPTNGGPNDVVKVCLVTPNSTTPLCCATKEFPVPDCAGANCKIYDLVAAKTPCLCGQFFAILNFEFKDGGSGGFDVVGNGKNYGNFPYDHPQPIVIGPLDGDGVTEYEFAVRDHLHPDCHDAVKLGIVDCTGQVQSGTNTALAATGGKLTLSPNPASQWLSVTAQLNSGSVIGQATAEIRQADGRLVRTLVVPDGGNFQIDVSELPGGMYRLSLLSAAARLEGTFAKQ